MPTNRYARAPHFELPTRSWPTQTLSSVPLWSSVDLRDGNQALPNPMDLQRKSRMFDLLVSIGFKDIEVGYPSSSQADFDFVRDLIERDRIPDDVTIGVFTPAKLDLIDRTVEAIRGANRAVVHLCNATACLWREVVFGMTPQQVQAMAEEAAAHMMRACEKLPGTQISYEYSPETFNVTEPELVLDVSNSIAKICGATTDRPLILNLPSTVETDSPNVFADQIEWMHRSLDNRAAIILSVHPHNDRGTAVASAELALMSGADRVEGTLFGNGERTGNVCLATLALNFFSRGIDPQLDFSDIDAIRADVEFCNQMSVPERHPYVGDLVYTAFSGTHQDAIAKGISALSAEASVRGVDPVALPWQVPYLPIDPKDVGRSYESVVRLNSQSGKGGIAHILRSSYGLDLPSRFRRDLSRVVQRVAETTGTEIEVGHLWETFAEEYLYVRSPLMLKDFDVEHQDGDIRLDAIAAGGNGTEIRLHGSGPGVAEAAVDALNHSGFVIELGEKAIRAVDGADDGRTAVYVELSSGGRWAWGVGIEVSAVEAELRSVLSALGRARSNEIGV